MSEFAKLSLITGAQSTFSKVNAGNNNLPDWVINREVGKSDLGTPYFDSVKFKLSDKLISQEFINSYITISNATKVVRTMVRGRKGSVKQLIDQEDWDITFKIDIFPKLYPNGTDSLNQSSTSIENVGKGNQGSIDGILNFIAEPSLTQSSSLANQISDHYPNDELRNLLDLLETFYSDKSYKNMEVESLYLNNNLNIKYIVPYSIVTSQNEKFTNTYSVIIKAYSDDVDDSDIFEVPKELL